ncbi:MAG: hypothetical protein WDA24_01275 [Tissierellales bacterium]
MDWEGMKKKGVNWFKSTSNSQDSLDKDHIEQETANPDTTDEEQIDDVNKHDKVGIHNDNYLFSKDNQDKVVLDLIVSLENMIKDRRLILYRNKGLEDQLYTSTETTNRMKQELMKKDQVLQENGKEIRKLESTLTNKQMSYDQLLEDYKEYQSKSNIEYERVSNQLDAEINKYNKFNEEFTSFQHQNILKINELEETIRSLKIENQQYIQQYQQISDEKSQLMQTINDFTSRMSFSFSQRQSTPDSSDSK